MRHYPDRIPTDFPRALDHSIVILESVAGDLSLAQESVMMMADSDMVTVGYAQRLLWLVMSHGDC